MMKFKYLFDDINLANMLVANWEYDSIIPADVDFWRSSANAVYTFTSDGERYFLRVAPIEEKDPQKVLAELEFLDYLKKTGYPVVEAVPAKDGNDMVVRDTPWGKYIAVVFRQMPGDDLEEIGSAYSDNLFLGLAKC